MTAQSPLSRIQPTMAAEFATFLLFVGFTPADLDLLFDGDAEFRAEVQAEMNAQQQAQQQEVS